MMGYDIITDRERGLAALYNPGTFRALGPVAQGDNAEQQLEAFVGALNGEVTEYTPWDLMAYWDAYAMTAAEQMATLEQDAAEQLAANNGQAPQEAAGEDGGESHGLGLPPVEEAAIEAEAGADTPPEPWQSRPQCSNCSNRTFHVEGGELVCQVCGTAAPEGAVPVGQ